MDKRVHYLIGIDTETCNGFTENGKLDLSQSLVYDIGWNITNKKGKIYKTRSFVIYEVFVLLKDVMQSAYYADKIPQYEEDIKNGTRKLVRFSTAHKIFLQDIKEYRAKAVFAHNASFDVRALNNTLRYLTQSRKRFFFPFGIEIWDTLKMARQTIARQKGYESFCRANNFMTKHKTPRCRCTAEVLYKYLTGDLDFQENHTGLEDVLIETYILMACFKTHKSFVKKLWARR